MCASGSLFDDLRAVVSGLSRTYSTPNIPFLWVTTCSHIAMSDTEIRTYKSDRIQPYQDIEEGLLNPLRVQISNSSRLLLLNRVSCSLTQNKSTYKYGTDDTRPRNERELPFSHPFPCFFLSQTLREIKKSCRSLGNTG